MFLVNFISKTLFLAGTTDPHGGEHFGQTWEDFDTVVDVCQMGLNVVAPVLVEVAPQLRVDLAPEQHQLLTGLRLLQLDVDEDPGEYEDDPVSQEPVLRFTGGKGPVDVELLQLRYWHAGDHCREGDSCRHHNKTLLGLCYINLPATSLL